MEYLTDNIKTYIIQHAKETYPYECCGLIIKNKDVIYPVKCKNISEDPIKSFIIDNDDIQKYDFNLIVGFYHSHKDFPDFSLADIAFSEKLKKNCVLYIVDSRIFKEYSPRNIEIPYEGRPFMVGNLDCLTLVQDYYRRELNIKLSQIQHPEKFNRKYLEDINLWHKYKCYSILEDYLINEGFTKVNELEKHDIILMRTPKIKFPIHVGVYLGDNRILHHYFEFSEISAYTNVYKRFTTGVYRHKNLI